MPWKEDFFRSLDLVDPLGERTRVRLNVERGKVVDFVVQYETPRSEKSHDHYPVVRYDGSHQRVRRDLLDRRGETIRKTWLPDSYIQRGAPVRHRRHRPELATLSPQLLPEKEMSTSFDPKTRERISADMALTSRFVRAVIDDPSILDEIPPEAYVFLIPDDDPELAEANKRGAAQVVRAGRPVYVRHLPAATAPDAANPSPNAV